MLTRLEPTIPTDPGWLYEPKWDGFRALVFRDSGATRILSRNGQVLDRYLPELLDPLAQALPVGAVVDGELIIERGGELDFDALLQRIHPAASRIQRLAAETPASFVAFDLLAADGEALLDRPLTERRERLQRLLRPSPRVFLTSQTRDPEVARRWFEGFERAGLDGIVAKREDQRYAPGERLMVKVKHERTADCVVGGYRRATRGTGVASLLLGLYDQDGVLNYAGHTSGFSAAERRELLERLRPIEGGPSFGEGRSPGGPSRWSRGRETTWIPVRPELVCEVAFDRLQGERFRHATRFIRWRPDKQPRECTYDQLRPAARTRQEPGPLPGRPSAD
jgi:ATP-dependent DNA ligase